MWDTHNHYPVDNKFQTSVLNALTNILNGEKTIMAKLADLTVAVKDLQAKVAAETTLEASIEALLTDMAAQQKILADQLAAAIAENDPVAIQAVADGLAQSSVNLDSNIAGLTAAVTANTPAAPPV